MRGESAGQKEILQNYGTVEIGEKKNRWRQKKSAEGNQRGVLSWHPVA